MEAQFEALIKQLNVRSLVSGDKEAQMLLRFVPTDDLVDKLNRLMKADELVKITIKNG